MVATIEGFHCNEFEMIIKWVKTSTIFYTVGK